MLATDRVKEIFADAHAMHGEALERLAAGDIRDAAEKAWCATLRATDALILSWTGHEPELSPATTRELDRLADGDRRLKPLVGRYYSRQMSLHGHCFYLGLCDPPETIERRIRETIDYITDAERLAYAGQRQ